MLRFKSGTLNGWVCGLLCLPGLAGCGPDEESKPEPTTGIEDGGGAKTKPPSADAGKSEPTLDASHVDACQPHSCESLDMNCGTASDGCGGTLVCGDLCDAGAGIETDAAMPCEPKTCADEGKNCGALDDGCGAELDCGTCVNDGDCGAVVPNVCGCPENADSLSAPPKTARRARSVGFSGSQAAYNELYDVLCETVADCASACEDRGGTTEMCATSECPDNFGEAKDCLPPPVWRNLQGIRFESDEPTEGVQLTLVAHPYADFLIADEYKLEVPEAATITGVTVELRRAGDSTVADSSVRLVKNGEIGEAERAKPQVWSDELTWVTYGGADDLWGETLTPEDVNADDFGVALALLYTQTVGNTRAYVDQARVTVHYQLSCE